MTPKDIFRTCVRNLLRRKARTMLTVLGVVIGCCSIVIMVSIGIGMKESQERMLAQMGDLTIINVTPQQSGSKRAKLDSSAITKFQKIEGVVAASPKLSSDNLTMVLYAGPNKRYVANWVTAAGINSGQMDKLGYELLEGSYTGQGQSGGKTVVVGQYAAYSFSDTMRPAGQNTVDRYSYMYNENGEAADPSKMPEPYFDPLKNGMTLEVTASDGSKFTVPLTVTGRVKEDYNKGWETSEGIMLDIKDMEEIIKRAAPNQPAKNSQYQSAVIKVTNIGSVAQVEKEIKMMGFNTSSMESIRKPIEKEAEQKQLMLGGLGAISLFVAALGITNTMIMSISERTREIGIMKALGCYVRDIRAMFLGEAAAIGLIGGVCGCVISVLISCIMNIVSAGESISSAETLLAALMPGAARMSVIPPWLLAFAIVFSIGIGLASGYYPSDRAVKIPALEAIKND